MVICPEQKKNASRSSTAGGRVQYPDHCGPGNFPHYCSEILRHQCNRELPSRKVESARSQPVHQPGVEAPLRRRCCGGERRVVGGRALHSIIPGAGARIPVRFPEPGENAVTQ